MQPYTVLLVPSDHFSWLGLEEMLRRQPEARIAGVARDADAAARIAAAQQPTCVIVAADLDDAPLITLVEEVRARCPRGKVVAIGPILGPAEHAALAGLKLACYLRWEEVSPERLRCVLALVRDADVRVASGVAVDLLAPPDRRRRPRERGLVLSERERAVLAGLAAGRTREEIAAGTHLGLRTVKRTIAALCVRFDAPTLFVLGMTAVAHGFAPSGQQPWPRRASQRGKMALSGHKVGPKNPSQPAPTRCIVDPSHLYREHASARDAPSIGRDNGATGRRGG